MTATSFFVAGIPVPQGSKKAFVVGKRAVIVDVKPELLAAWRQQVARVAFSVFAFRGPVDGPCRVDAAFVLPRPASVKRDLPSVPPDLDKLLRAVFDGITQAENVWPDDSRVVEAHTSKVYGAAPGVHVTITPISGVTVLVPSVCETASAVEEGTAA
ncbi:Holliday junction resolvase RusA-like endonuclease [Microbacterium testaceum]|uniref:RusA family crossover junction endodeoxyribonuclease n=1 Tax=Microbacterium testaceum TaxID=2033 RepID=UPI0027804B30|nr:RusA family crossover junction endodeoxyribonuclease [Microbacterium testaceum]MDQ1174208.1 Holliday junction resolvase RusA-like endonuclease [Microbacterium testaceum]